MSASSTTASRAGASSQRAEWRFLLPLALLAAAALAVRWYVASRTYINFDEWQQIFMAKGPRWKDLTFELRNEAHPPVFYALLRLLVMFGHGPLLYRAISTVPGAVSVFLAGLFGRKVFRSAGVALAGAGALAFSTAAIGVSTEVRQYPLTMMLVLAAFLAYLNIWPGGPPARTRDYATFSVACTIALSCHYSAIFFFAACLGVPLLLAPRAWKALVWEPGNRRRAALAVALPLGVFLYFYFHHARRLPLLGYLRDYYFREWPQERWFEFLLRNGQNFWNLFAPVPVHSAAWFLAALAAVVAGGLLLLWKESEPLPDGRRSIRLVAPAVTAAICAGLVCASILRKYPFGGELRHQYIAGPFLLLTAFGLLDRMAGRGGPKVRMTLVAVAGLAVAANLVAAWPGLIVYPGETIYSEEYGGYRAAFPNAPAIYLDHWGVIAYFIQTQERDRRFVRRISDVAWIDEYRMEGAPAGPEIFYDKTRYHLNLNDARLYDSFVACLKQSGLKELTLFLFITADAPFPDDPEAVKRTLTEKAAEHGLAVTKVEATATEIFAGLALR